MSTKETIQGYFNELKQKKAWDSFLAEDMTFTSFVVPIKHLAGKTAYIDSTRRFFSMTENDRACVTTRYELQPPKGSSFKSDVAEVFTVKNGKIDSLSIYFDSSPFPK